MPSQEKNEIRVGWGAGIVFQNQVQSQQAAAKFAYLVDSDPGKWGQELLGLRIMAPETLRGEDPERLSVTIFSSRWPEICDTLGELGFSDTFIAQRVFKPSTASQPEFADNLRRLRAETLQTTLVTSFPVHLNFDVTNICNLRCPLCPTGQRDNRYPKGRMRFADFKKVLDEIGRYAANIYLFNWGEPFLNPEIFRMIEYVKGHFPCRVTVSSNFNTVEEKEIRAMVDSGLDFLTLSIDGGCQDTYAAYRVGGDFARVQANIRAILAYKEKTGSPTPFVEWRYLVNAYNDDEAEIERAREMARQLGIGFFLGQIHVDMGREIEEGLDTLLARDGHWISKKECHSAYDFNNRQRREKKDFCKIPWEIAYINWNGDLMPCCGLYDPKYALGNVFNEPFVTVWNGPAMQETRKVLIANDTSADHICARCRQGGFIV